MLCSFLELSLFTRSNVGYRALWKAVYKHRAFAPSKENDRAIPARLSLSNTRNPLLDHSAPQVGIDQSFLRSLDGIEEGQIQDALPSGEPLKPL